MSLPPPRSPQQAAVGGPATELDTTGAAVDVSGSAPPSPGDVLTATDATHATWQAPGASSSADSTILDWLGW